MWVDNSGLRSGVIRLSGYWKTKIMKNFEFCKRGLRGLGIDLSYGLDIGGNPEAELFDRREFLFIA